MIKFLFILFLKHQCARVHTHVCCDMYVEVREQLWSWFSPETLNVGHQASGQVSLLAELSQQPRAAKIFERKW